MPQYRQTLGIIRANRFERVVGPDLVIQILQLTVDPCHQHVAITGKQVGSGRPRLHGARLARNGHIDGHSDAFLQGTLQSVVSSEFRDATRRGPPKQGRRTSSS